MNIPYLNKNETKLLLQVKKDLERHEGFREFAYPDPLSKLAATQKSKDWGFRPAKDIMKPGTNPATGNPWTYGFGFAVGVTPESRISRVQAERKLEEHILAMDSTLADTLSWYRDASYVTRGVLINMAFNLGVVGLLKFKNSLAFLKAKDYQKAAHNLTLSLWYKQVGQRARELVTRIETQQIAPAHLAPERL